MTNKNKFQKFALVLYIIFVIILFVLFSSVLIKTAQRGDSLSSTGDFSRDGVMDYETTEQNDTSEQDTEGTMSISGRASRRSYFTRLSFRSAT